MFVGVATCAPATGGLIVGDVVDANTGAGVAATLYNDAGYTARASVLDAPGTGAFYTLFAPAGTHTVTATMTGYAPGVVAATLTPGAAVERDIALAAGVLASTPESLALTLTAGLTATRAITLNNSGGYTASFTMLEINAPFTPITVTGPFAGMARRVSPKHLHDLNAATVREYEPPAVPLLVAGAVITTWESGLISPWGVAYDTDADVLWVSDTRLGGGEDRNVAFYPDGAPTGVALATSPWVSLFAADIAYNPITGKLWQANVGDDNCVYEMDPVAATATGRVLCPPFGVSERGLAYDPTTNTFYSGSWNDQILYHFDATGRLLDSRDLKLNIAGLAYNPATRHLFVMSNAEIGRDVYVLDVADGYAVIGGFDIDGLGGLEQAGLTLDCDGNLWAVNQMTGQVIQAVSGETGVCAWEEIAWLTTAPVSGTVGIGAAQTVSLHIDTSSLDSGVYPVHVRVANSTPYGELNVPITLTVVQPYDVLLLPTAAAQSGLPGAPVTYTLTVTNTGLETDTFTVTLSGNDWPTHAVQTVGPLASGESAPLTVTVSVPGAALCGASDMVTVTLTSQGNPIRLAEATLTTSAAAVFGVQAHADRDAVGGGSRRGSEHLSVDDEHRQLRRHVRAGRGERVAGERPGDDGCALGGRWRCHPGDGDGSEWHVGGDVRRGDVDCDRASGYRCDRDGRRNDDGERGVWRGALAADGVGRRGPRRHGALHTDLVQHRQRRRYLHPRGGGRSVGDDARSAGRCAGSRRGAHRNGDRLCAAGDGTLTGYRARHRCRYGRHRDRRTDDAPRLCCRGGRGVRLYAYAAALRAGGDVHRHGDDGDGAHRLHVGFRCWRYGDRRGRYPHFLRRNRDSPLHCRHDGDQCLRFRCGRTHRHGTPAPGVSATRDTVYVKRNISESCEGMRSFESHTLARPFCRR